MRSSLALFDAPGMAVLGDDALVLAESHADRLTAWTIDALGRARRTACLG